MQGGRVRLSISGVACPVNFFADRLELVSLFVAAEVRTRVDLRPIPPSYVGG